MQRTIFYNIRLTEEQLLNYLNAYRVFSPKEFDSRTDLVEIVISIYAKRYLESNSHKKLLIAFETTEKIETSNINLSVPSVVHDILNKRDFDSYIDFMLVPMDKPDIAYAFQIKRFFINASDKNIEGTLAEKINTYLKTRPSQEIYLILAPDKKIKSIVWPTKIDISALRKLIKKQDKSYKEVFIMLDNNKLIHLT